MAKSVEIQAKTIDEAIELGLEQLGAAYDEVDFEIISNGGMFKKAKVKITMKEGVKKSEPKVEPKPEPKKEVKPEPVKEVQAEKQAEKPVKREERKPIEKREQKPVVAGESAKVDACVKFVTELLAAMGSECGVTCTEDERSFTIEISGDDVGRLIGKGGEAMHALQVIVQAVGQSHKEDRRRVFVNIENYKERRAETLKALAERKAAKVLESGRTIKLDPMNPRDRAIIHTALQDIEGVRSYSVGEGNDRRLCIALAKKESE
ncbi:MAG: KH domain-containing protein [Firmicutes bacterium]|nr:KH domain-containing protein [Bacillota bacterium]